MRIYNKLQTTSLMLVIYFNGFFLFTGISRSDTIHANRWSEDSPYKTVGEGVEAAQPGDVLSILGPYYYPERLVINKRLTLIANSGIASIGECKQIAQPGELIKQQDAHFIVNNKETLLSALERAKPGNIICIRDDARINLNGEKNIIISEGVTLASGRGYKL